MKTTVDELLDTFWSNYPQMPSEHERKSLTAWGVALRDNNLLEEVLDINKHPKQSNGAIPKPNLAMLKDLVHSAKITRGDFEHQADKSLLDDEDCFYCEHGHILAVDSRTEYWREVVMGRCKHCKAGEADSSWLKPTEPFPWVIELARLSGRTCPEVVSDVVAAHEAREKVATQ